MLGENFPRASTDERKDLHKSKQGDWFIGKLRFLGGCVSLDNDPRPGRGDCKQIITNKYVS